MPMVQPAYEAISTDDFSVVRTPFLARRKRSKALYADIWLAARSFHQELGRHRPLRLGASPPYTPPHTRPRWRFRSLCLRVGGSAAAFRNVTLQIGGDMHPVLNWPTLFSRDGHRPGKEHVSLREKEA